MILASILALLSIPITASIASLLTMPLVAVEIRLQLQGKSGEYWQERGILNPGERVPWISFLFGLIGTAVTKTSAILGAAAIFNWFGHTMPLWFVLLSGGLIVLHDFQRIRRFLGNSGVWCELGYLCGDITGVANGAILAFYWIA